MADDEGGDGLVWYTNMFILRKCWFCGGEMGHISGTENYTFLSHRTARSVKNICEPCGKTYELEREKARKT